MIIPFSKPELCLCSCQEATAKFQTVADAYYVLSDPGKLYSYRTQVHNLLL